MRRFKRIIAHQEEDYTLDPLYEFEEDRFEDREPQNEYEMMVDEFGKPHENRSHKLKPGDIMWDRKNNNSFIVLEAKDEDVFHPSETKKIKVIPLFEALRKNPQSAFTVDKNKLIISTLPLADWMRNYPNLLEFYYKHLPFRLPERYVFLRAKKEMGYEHY